MLRENWLNCKLLARAAAVRAATGSAASTLSLLPSTSQPCLGCLHRWWGQRRWGKGKGCLTHRALGRLGQTHAAAAAHELVGLAVAGGKREARGEQWQSSPEKGHSNLHSNLH